MIVNASIILSSLMRVSPYKPSYLQEVTLEVDPLIYSGFLLTITNRIEIRHETCSILDSLLFLEINHQKFKFGCLHYWVHYYESPLHLKFIPSILTSLSDSVNVVVTAIRFACPPFHGHFRQCPNHPIFCIGRDLFCDGVDNCGFHSDEGDCTKHFDQVSVVITDERSSATHYALFAVSFCFGITLMAIAIFSMHRMFKARKKKYVTIKSLFGGMKPPKLDTGEPEETVHLLTLGLKTFLPPMPNNNGPSMNYGSHRTSRPSLHFNRI